MRHCKETVQRTVGLSSLFHSVTLSLQAFNRRRWWFLIPSLTCVNVQTVPIQTIVLLLPKDILFLITCLLTRHITKVLKKSYNSECYYLYFWF